MVVAQDDRRCVLFQSLQDNFPGVDRGLGQGSPEHLFEADDAILRIQQQNSEHLMRAVPQLQSQEVSHCFGRTKRIGLPDFTCQQRKGLLHDWMGLIHVHGFA